MSEEPEAGPTFSHEVQRPRESAALTPGMEHAVKALVPVTGDEITILRFPQPPKHDVLKRRRHALQMVQIAIS